MIKVIKRGVVISNKNPKTVVVKVSRFVTHPIYKKKYRFTKKIAAHISDDSKYEIGDRVEIEESRPISKTKKFIVKSKIGGRGDF